MKPLYKTQITQTIKALTIAVISTSLFYVPVAMAGDRTALSSTQAADAFNSLCFKGGIKTSKVKRAVQKSGNYSEHSSSGITNSYSATHDTMAIDVEAMFDKGCQITFAVNGSTPNNTKEIAALLMKQIQVKKRLNQKADGSTVFETKKGRVFVINFSKLKPKHIQIGLHQAGS